MVLFPSYGANIFTLLNDDNEHYSAQWKWIMSELASAKENGEKVSRLFTEVLPHVNINGGPTHVHKTIGVCI